MGYIEMKEDVNHWRYYDNLVITNYKTGWCLDCSNYAEICCVTECHDQNVLPDTKVFPDPSDYFVCETCANRRIIEFAQSGGKIYDERKPKISDAELADMQINRLLGTLKI